MAKYIDAELLRKEIEKERENIEGLFTEGDNNFYEGQDDAYNNTLVFIASLQQGQQMPDSTKLIELWHEDKEMLKEKDFRNDPWRLAYNAFLCGFGRGIAVKKQEQPVVKDPFDDEQFRRGYEAGKHDAMREQKPKIELIQRSWYMEGYHDREFNKEPIWIIKTGKGGPRYEENPKYGQHIEKQDYSGLNDFERAIHRGFLCAGVVNVPVNIIKETAQDCLAHLPAEWSEDFDKEVENVHKRYPEVSFAKLTRIAYHFSKWANRRKDMEWREQSEKRK